MSAGRRVIQNSLTFCRTTRGSWSRSVRCASTAAPAAPRVVTSPVEMPEVPTGGLAGLLLDNMVSWGDKTATVCGLTGRQYTFAQMADRVSRWAGALTGMGLAKGDVVAVLMPNCPEYPVVMMGAVSIGVVVSPINIAYTAEEMAGLLKNCEARLVVCHPALVPTVEAALTLCQRPVPVVSNGPSSSPNTANLIQIIEDPNTPMKDPCEVAGEDIAMMPFSSGTTGPPKGVCISHYAFAANAAMTTQPYFFPTQETTSSYQGSFLGILPLFHVGGIIPLLMTMLKGLKMVYLPKFDPATFVDTITKHEVETLHLVPTLLNFMLHSPSATPTALSSVQTIVCGAAPVSPTAVHAFKDKLGRPFLFQEIYGMTEILVSMLSPVGAAEVGTCGIPLPGVQAKIIDTITGEDLLPHQDGEILVKTPTVMDGYFKNPEATADTIDSEGWLHTGDVGHYDEQGYFTIVDRTKELLKVKGLQVAPSELEDLLRQYPGVVDVGVVGVPHDRLGDAPRAYIVASKTIPEADIQAFVESRVAPHKRLVGGVAFVEALPKTPIGKLLRRELRRMAAE